MERVCRWLTCAMLFTAWGCGSGSSSSAPPAPSPTAAGPTAHPLVQDGATLLLLRFDGVPDAVSGDAPSLAQGLLFVPGVVNQAAFIGPGARLQYPLAGHFNTDEGTLEFWIRPEWGAGTGSDAAILSSGRTGGMLFARDASDNLRVIFNRLAANGRPEEGVIQGIADWVAWDWHHVAFTWSNPQKTIQLYIDGLLQQEAAVQNTLPPLTSTEMDIGTDSDGTTFADAAIDELRVSSIVRSAAEIKEDATLLTSSSLEANR